MYLPSPKELALPYMQAMCAALCIDVIADKPRVLQLGLGGGAINRFLLANDLVDALISVESSAAVVRLYRQYFSAEFAVHGNCASEQLQLAEAGAFVAEQQATYDLIFCDLFDIDSTPDLYLSPSFFSDLARLCAGCGALVLNLPFREPHRLQPVFNILRPVFNVLCLAELPGYKNIVLYATQVNWQLDSARAAHLSALMPLDVVEHFSRSVKPTSI